MNNTVVKSAPPIYSHTGLRGIAALYVFVFHITGGADSTRHFRNEFYQFFEWGEYAVYLFFILSGFILNWVYLINTTPMNWASYWKARVARIVPLYILTTLLSMPFTIYSWARYGNTYLGKDFHISDFITNIILNALLISGIVGPWQRTLNPPAWSISVEFFCYLAIFPLLVYFRKLLVNKTVGLVALIILAAAFTYGLVAYAVTPPIAIYNWYWDPHYLGEGIYGFSAGFFLCSIYRMSSRWYPQAYVINLLVMAILGIFLLVRFDLLPSCAFLCALPFLVYFTAMDKGFSAKLLKTNLFQWIGDRSYSIYLWHSLCITYTGFLRKHFSDSVYIIIVLVLLLGIANISYRFFECPLREYIRKYRRN